ncbi:hypothetical protein ASG87_05105 [Frateuria sp. Soil773]|uniref:hypothetical protein n=1 Tax=Frateuria sp. Soil773 TaxID=1736407 RepID=UPI0006F25777|nr:hypothetical protein [Frateuria sp. Soil773]KRE88940.1 hypothetical protein ASG87_05105 [Frateuria sp. Soil773]
MMRASAWIPPICLIVIGIGLTSFGVRPIFGLDAAYLGTALILAGIWWGLAVGTMSRSDSRSDHALEMRLRDWLAILVSGGLALAFLDVMSQVGWNHPWRDPVARRSVTGVVLASIAWQVISSRWLVRLKAPDTDLRRFRVLLLVLVPLLCIYFALLCLKIQVLPPIFAGNVLILVLLLAQFADAIWVKVRPRVSTHLPNPPGTDAGG